MLFILLLRIRAQRLRRCAVCAVYSAERSKACGLSLYEFCDDGRTLVATRSVRFGKAEKQNFVWNLAKARERNICLMRETLRFSLKLPLLRQLFKFKFRCPHSLHYTPLRKLRYASLRSLRCSSPFRAPIAIAPHFVAVLFRGRLVCCGIMPHEPNLK